MSDVKQGRSRLGLIVIAVLFLGPMFGAFIAYQGGWQPGGQTAHGLLLNPARPIPALTLSGIDGTPLPENLLRREWTLLYVGAARCEEVCQQQLYYMRQVWKSLGRRAKRVQGVYLLAAGGDSHELEGFLQTEHQGLILARSQPGQTEQWLDFFSLDKTVQPLQEANIYLLDPLGNWVLLYRPTDPAQGLLKDLKKLLKLSQIG